MSHSIIFCLPLAALCVAAAGQTGPELFNVAADALTKILDDLGWEAS